MGTFTSYDQFDAPTSVAALSFSTETVTNCKEIVIQADHDNSGFVMIGDYNTSASGTLRGTKVHSGETLILAIADTRLVYLEASAASQN